MKCIGDISAYVQLIPKIYATQRETFAILYTLATRMHTEGEVSRALFLKLKQFRALKIPWLVA